MNQTNICDRLIGKKAICIVAHPDDETIWMGGTIMRCKKTRWTIFSLCRSSDIDRAPKFKKVCNYYKAKSIMTDLDDDNDINFDELVTETKNIIKEKIDIDDYDYIFTHGGNGEYGHDRHVVVYEAIKQLAEEDFFGEIDILNFSYKKKNEEEEFSQMIPGGCLNEIVELSDNEYNNKKEEVMVGLYGFDSKGIDANLCTEIESFCHLK